MQRDQAHRTNELLERIAIALEKNNKVSNELVDATTKDIPGFEGVLNDLDNLYQPDLSVYGKKDDDNDLNEARKFANLLAIEDEYETDGTSVGNGKYEDEYTYDNDLNEYKYVSKVGKIKNDSDFDIRVTAKMYEDDVLANGGTKKDCILDYVTNEFGLHGARYTDIIKFAYYLGAPNAPKFNNSNRGYYACALTHGRWNTGHLVTGGKDQLVKGINTKGKERYFALSSVDSFTDYYKRLDQ